MSGLFNYDNPVWRFIGKFWDVLIVNLLWMICSIPIVTIGASTTAMYYVTLRLVRDEDGYTIKSFFKSFKENFKQATIIWLIFLAAIMVLGFDLYFVIMTMTTASKFRTAMVVIFTAMTFIWFAMFTYVFPLQARFYNPVKKTIFNSFFMSIRHLFYTIGILIIDVGLIYLTLNVIPQLMLFGVALGAYANSYLLHVVFEKYIPKSDREDIHEMRPLFADEEEEEARQAALAAAEAKTAEEAQDLAPEAEVAAETTDLTRETGVEEIQTEDKEA